jgi:hypothetical protein
MLGGPVMVPKTSLVVFLDRITLLLKEVPGSVGRSCHGTENPAVFLDISHSVRGRRASFWIHTLDELRCCYHNFAEERNRLLSRTLETV